MAWKQLYQGEVQQVTKDETGLVGKQSVFSLGLDGMIGKHIRVTVEEEVNECCEKWRGRIAISCGDLEYASLRVSGGIDVLSRPTFCPECGNKL